MRFLTAGESHGPGLTVIVDDVPAGVPLCAEDINRELARRQLGYGRSARQKIERDEAVINGGVRFGKTTGAPVAMWIANRDHANWQEVLKADGEPTPEAAEKAFSRPRPGHADLAGYYKYGQPDLRDVLERASARETAARVAAGAVARALLKPLGIEVFSHVTALGGVFAEDVPSGWQALRERAESNDLRCAGSDAELSQMRQAVDSALQAGTTLGGEIEIVAVNVPPGLGSYAQWDRRLDGLLAQAVMSVQAVKSVGIGAGAEGAVLSGDRFQDEILADDGRISRQTNRAGGLEGGVTNGMPLVLRAVMKPISTMRTPLQSVDLTTGEPEPGHFERSDVTAVPACGVVCEAMVAVTLARAVMDKFGRDALTDIQAGYEQYLSRLKPEPAIP